MFHVVLCHYMSFVYFAFGHDSTLNWDFELNHFENHSSGINALFLY